MNTQLKRFLPLGLLVLVVLFLIYLSVSPRIVVDDAHVMTATHMRTNQLKDYHNELLRLHDIDFRVYTANNMGDVNRIANQKFSELKVGSLSHKGYGVLFIVDPAQNLVRMEISAGLEGVFPDAFISFIERKNMVEYFKAGQIPEGIVSSTQFIFDRAKEDASGLAFSSDNTPGISNGAGVKIPAQIGTGKTENAISSSSTGKQLEPLEAFTIFLNSMKDGVMNYDPRLFTRNSLDMIRNAVIPPALVRKTYKKFSACTIDAVKIKGDYAVIRFSIKDHQCMPYFMRIEDGLWKFDLVGMTAITSSFEDVWALEANGAPEYHFAFDDWRMAHVRSLSTGRDFLVPIGRRN